MQARRKDHEYEYHDAENASNLPVHMYTWHMYTYPCSDVSTRPRFLDPPSLMSIMEPSMLAVVSNLKAVNHASRKVSSHAYVTLRGQRSA